MKSQQAELLYGGPYCELGSYTPPVIGTHKQIIWIWESWLVDGWVVIHDWGLTNNPP